MAVLDLGKVVPEKGTDYFTEQDIEEIVSEVKSEITVPTKTSDLTNDSGFIDKTVNDLTNYELKTNTGATIELSINSSTYVMTMVLKNSSGTALSTQTVDLPLESVVVSGSYDNTNKKIVLTLQNGSTIDVPVGDLVSGLQAEITNNNKLSSDLVDDTNHTNLFVTASEKTTWNGKQDTLTAGNNITIQNNVISASGGDCNLPVITLDIENGTTTDPKSKSDASKVVNDAYNAGIKYTAILLRATSGVLINGSQIAYPSRYANFDEQKTLYRFYCMAPGESYQIKLGIEFTIYGTWNNNVFTCSGVGITGGNFYSFGNYLKKDNTSAYTPTPNSYNPATTKYVDDAIASAITTTLGGSY